MTSSKLGIDTQTGETVYLHKLSRLLGLYIVGLQGMGKSGLFEELIIQDIKQGIGVCVLDPHGELIEHIIARLPDKTAEEKMIYLDLADIVYPFGLNLFACADLHNELSIEETRSQVLHVFEKAFGITPANPLMYTLLSNCAYTLIANPGYTMIDIRQLLTSKTCREMLLQNVRKSHVRDYWHDYYDQLSPQDQRTESSYILNKLNDFENAPQRYIVGQSQSTLNLQEIMDEGKILLVKLSRRLEQATKLVGSIIVALILNAAYNRPSQRRQFHLYADEFQNFATEDFAVLLEEARKRGIGITMAHQNRAQLELSDKQADKQLKDRTLNVGNLVVFRVPTDADELAGQFDCTPPPGEVQYENARVISPTPVDSIMLGRPHKNHVVNEFFKPWRETVQTAHESIRKWVQKRSFYFEQDKLVSNREEVEKAQAWLDTINGFLYQVMSEKNPRCTVPLGWFMDRAESLSLQFMVKSRYQGSAYVGTSLSGKETTKDMLLACGVEEDEYVNINTIMKWRDQHDYVWWLLKTLNSQDDVLEVVKQPTAAQLALYDRLAIFDYPRKKVK